MANGALADEDPGVAPRACAGDCRASGQIHPHLGYAARSFLASPAPTGPLPAPQFSPADYWAYGVGSGLEFKY